MSQEADALRGDLWALGMRSPCLMARACAYATSAVAWELLRDLTFDVDPHDPRRMIDGTGRVLYYKGNLRMQYSVLNPHRRLQAITEEDDEWIVL